MKNRYISLLMALALAVSLAGCDFFEPDATEASGVEGSLHNTRVFIPEARATSAQSASRPAYEIYAETAEEQIISRRHHASTTGTATIEGLKLELEAAYGFEINVGNFTEGNSMPFTTDTATEGYRTAGMRTC